MFNQSLIRFHESSLNTLSITEGRGSSLWQLPRLWWHIVLSFWQLEMPPMRWGFLFDDPFVFHWLPYNIQSTYLTRVPVIAVQPSWWVQTIRWIMLNTFVVIYCANVRPIKISSVQFCSMDIDVPLGPHKFSQQANINYQWTLHIFQSWYYICQLFPWAFFCDHDRIAEYKMTDTNYFSMAYIVVYWLIIEWVWSGMGGL